MRPAQSGTSGTRGRPRTQGNRTQGRVFHMTQEDARAASDVVAGMLYLNSFSVYVLFDPGATHSFIATRLVPKLELGPKCVKREFVIGTPLGESVDVGRMYQGV